MNPENWFWLSVRLLATFIMLGFMVSAFMLSKAHGAHVPYLLGVFHGVLLLILLDTLYWPK